MGKKSQPEGKKYSYMDTYGDLVTLLLCFFVLLFAMSTIEENKYNAFMQAMQGQFGTQMGATPEAPPGSPAPPTSVSSPNSGQGEDTPRGDTMTPDQTLPADFNQLAEAIEKYVEEHDMQGAIEVQAGESGTAYIRLSNNLLFDGDSYELRPEARQFLDFLGQCFLEVESEIFQANFIGHTADIPGSATDDWMLSARRAGGVSSYFEKVIGFDPAKIELTGYGRMYPIADNATPEGRAQNRRVDIVVVGNNPELLAQALVESAAIYFPEDDTQFYEGAPEELPGNVLGEIPPTGTGDIDLTRMTPAQLEKLYEDWEAAQGAG